jgi:hypothetical protein
LGKIPSLYLGLIGKREGDEEEEQEDGYDASKNLY